ncbi:hypothetical protein DFH06DRAFT_1148087 [Mycena polygramma]|nr:hypothetical protein DFH06DRAFT_1148087 [Mycena polygramma]
MYSPFVLLDAVFESLTLFPRLQRLEANYIRFTPARVDILRHLPSLSELNVVVGNACQIQTPTGPQKVVKFHKIFHAPGTHTFTRANIMALPSSAGSPVSPRRQLLMDRIAALEFKAAALTSENTNLKENNESLVSRADDLGRQLHNKSRQAIRARVSAGTLRAALKRSKHARVVQTGRLNRRKRDGIAKAMHDARISYTRRWMKGKGGIFTETSREMFRELVALKVSPENIDPVIHTVGRGLGFQVQDHISARHVGRVMEEAGIASDIQVAMEIDESKAVALSGDGTKIRHIDYEAKHVTFRDARTGRPITRILDVTSARDHTSESQMEGWRVVLLEGLVKTYNSSPLGQVNPIDEDEFITFIKGLGTDHANDQKKLARLINEWTTNARKIMMGKTYLLTADIQQYLPAIARFNAEKITAAGGLDAWNALPAADKVLRDIAVCRALYAHFGEGEWKNLSPEAQLEAQSLVWCGCCMHKEMNSVKGGVEGMKLFWQSVGGPAPVKLMNKANNAAVSKSQEGGVGERSRGVRSLLGALFNHKDDKRGQQDTFKLYFEHLFGYPISCPDTSNTRFQSHCDCAIFIIIHLPQILLFMSHIMYSKGKVGLNHLEANVLKGIQDISTLTELCVLALYTIAICYAYLRVVRATGDLRRNALDLAELHAKVIAFCEAVAANTDLLLAADASFETGTLDGQPWEHPDVFYAIQRIAPTLPNLAGCLKAFMTGAADTWKRFGEEYHPDGVIARLSAAARAKIYINPTNDHNEGALGRLRRAVREAARLSLSAHNAKSKYTINDTRNFLRSATVTDALRTWLRAEARKRIDSGRDRKRRMDLIEHENVVVAEKQAAETKRKARAAEILAELQNLTPLLDVAEIEATHRNITVTDLVKNINWHRQFVEVGTIPQKTLISKMSKADKVTQLITAVHRYNGDILPRLQMLALAAMTAGIGDCEVGEGIPIVESWDAEDEALEDDMRCRPPLNVFWATFAPGRYTTSSSSLRVSNFEEVKTCHDMFWISMLHPDHLHILRTAFHPGGDLDCIPSFPNVHTLDVTMYLAHPSQNVAILNKFPTLQVLKLRGKNLLSEAVSLPSPPVLPALTEYSGPYQYLPLFLALDTVAHLTVTSCSPFEFISCIGGVRPNITSISVKFDTNTFDIATFGTLVGRLPALTDIRIHIVVPSRSALFESKTHNLQSIFDKDVVVRGRFGNSIRTGFKPSAFFSALPNVAGLPHSLEHLAISWDCNSLRDVHHRCAYKVPDFSQLHDALRARCPELRSIELHGLFFLLEWPDATEE